MFHSCGDTHRMGESDHMVKAPHMKTVTGPLIDQSQRDRAKSLPESTSQKVKWPCVGSGGELGVLSWERRTQTLASIPASTPESLY